jgi:hypothetical protein
MTISKDSKTDCGRLSTSEPCYDVDPTEHHHPALERHRTSIPPWTLLNDAVIRAKLAREKFGPHDSAEFAVCRLTEEVGELAQAATAMSKNRDKNRRERIRDEAIDVIAMVIRLLQEFPDGKPGDP